MKYMKPHLSRLWKMFKHCFCTCRYRYRDCWTYVVVLNNFTRKWQRIRSVLRCKRLMKRWTACGYYYMILFIGFIHVPSSNRYVMGNQLLQMSDVLSAHQGRIPCTWYDLYEYVGDFICAFSRIRWFWSCDYLYAKLTILIA